MIGVRAPSPQLALAAGGIAATSVVLVDSAPLSRLPLAGVVRLPPPGRAILIASAVTIGLTVSLAPHRAPRHELLAAGLAALGAMAILVAVADPLGVALLVLMLGFASATWTGLPPSAAIARGPAFAALLLGVGWAFHRTVGPAWMGRTTALFMALSLVAAAGLVPYMQDANPDEPARWSHLVWMGFFAPALALTLPARILPALTSDQAAIFGATLIGFGLINLGWGVVGAWRTASDTEAWRCSFLADWGLVLVGIGLFQPEGFAAAYLTLLAIVLVRLPLYLWARPGLIANGASRNGRARVVIAVALAGAAPFSGFPIRLLILQAATQAAWPLALLLLPAMVLWVAHSMRLARTLGAHGSPSAVGLGLTIAISLALGLLPGVFRIAAGV